jgi:hypothetical protein
MTARLRTLRLVLILSAAVPVAGCSFGRNVVSAARTVARLAARETEEACDLSKLTADVEKPAGANSILMAYFLVKPRDDTQLARFSDAFCADLSLRVTRLPEIRGQVPGWVADRAMQQLGIHSTRLSPQTAMKVARLAGRRYAMTGDVDRLNGKLRARLGIYDVRRRERVGAAIELVGTPQEFLDREGWLAEQVAQRIGVKLTAADRAWLSRRQFSRRAGFHLHRAPHDPPRQGPYGEAGGAPRAGAGVAAGRDGVVSMPRVARREGAPDGGPASAAAISREPTVPDVGGRAGYARWRQGGGEEGPR